MRKVKRLFPTSRHPAKILIIVVVAVCAMVLLGGGGAFAATLRGVAVWSNYQDQDYSFSVHFDASSWKPITTVYTPNNSDPQVIAKRVSFFGPKAEIRIDVWEHPEKDLVGWVRRDFTQRGASDAVAMASARVAGLPS